MWNLIKELGARIINHMSYTRVCMRLAHVRPEVTDMGVVVQRMAIQQKRKLYVTLANEFKKSIWAHGNICVATYHNGVVNDLFVHKYARVYMLLRT